MHMADFRSLQNRHSPHPGDQVRLEACALVAEIDKELAWLRA